MIRFEYTIKDEQGVHARPAGLLVKQASKYRSAVTLDKDGKIGDAKKIFAVMGLGIKCGDTVQVTVGGEDEEEAARELEKFFKENL